VQVLLDDYTLGAFVATDLVNTTAEVMVSKGEMLPDAAALGRFLAAHGLAPDTAAAPTDEDVRAVHALRATLRELLTEPDVDAVIARASALSAAAGSGLSLDRGADGRWHWTVRPRPGARVADELALLTATALLSVVRSLGTDRFRHCASPTCAGLFVDTSRAGRRRYCVPEVCGNRVNVAAHRSRRRAAQRQPGP
jgi:predicted RNA-binding Zn ribbon-like protein